MPLFFTTQVTQQDRQLEPLNGCLPKWKQHKYHIWKAPPKHSNKAGYKLQKQQFTFKVHLTGWGGGKIHQIFVRSTVTHAPTCVARGTLRWCRNRTQQSNSKAVAWLIKVNYSKSAWRNPSMNMPLQSGRIWDLPKALFFLHWIVKTYTVNCSLPQRLITLAKLDRLSSTAQQKPLKLSERVANNVNEEATVSKKQHYCSLCANWPVEGMAAQKSWIKFKLSLQLTTLNTGILFGTEYKQ